MDSLKDSLAYWSSILGTILGVLGLIESSPRLLTVGILLVSISAGTFIYARSQRRRVRLATVRIEGRSIDALNLASLGRRLNTSLVVQEADQAAHIRGADVAFTWRYTGYCRAPSETAVEFSIDTENNIPFEQFQCFAYDLQRDPRRTHRIRPVLVSADGLSKKLSVPFLEPLSAMEPFSVELNCKLPGCMKSGLEYYTSTLSVAQDCVPTSAVRLIFKGEHPAWLRVYECDNLGNVHLIKELQPSNGGEPPTQYCDLGTDVPAQSARIYMFYR